jgi:hypothetical protein
MRAVMKWVFGSVLLLILFNQIAEKVNDNIQSMVQTTAASISPSALATERMAARRVRLKVPSEIYNWDMISRLDFSST